LGNLFSNDLWCRFHTAPLVLASVFHAIPSIADIVLYHVVTFVLVTVIAGTEHGDKMTSLKQLIAILHWAVFL